MLLSLIPAVVLGSALCVDMDMSEVRTTACIDGRVVRIETHPTRVLWVLDFAKETSTLMPMGEPTVETKTFKQLASGADASTLKRMRAEVAAQRRKAAASKITPVDAPHEGGSCRLYELRTQGESSRLCVRPYPPGLAAEVRQFATLVRQAQHRYSPLVLQGLPLVNVDLPLYAKGGLISENQLVEVLTLSRGEGASPTEIRFSYRRDTPPPPRVDSEKKGPP